MKLAELTGYNTQTDETRHVEVDKKECVSEKDGALLYLKSKILSRISQGITLKRIR